MDLWTVTAEQGATDPALAAFFLDRLATLVRRRGAAIDARQRTALARSTFSVFLDCRDLGLGAQAAAIVERGAVALPPRGSAL